MRDVPSYNLFQFLDEWTRFSLFSEFIEKFIWYVGIYSFYEMNCFSRILWNNGKSGKDYISQVGLCFTCRMNYLILLHFYRILGKMQKTGTKIEYDKLGCIPLTGWILRFYPVFPELTQQTENRGEDWLWKARMYPTCGINCQILPYLWNGKWKIRLKIWYGKIRNSKSKISYGS